MERLIIVFVSVMLCFSCATVRQNDGVKTHVAMLEKDEENVAVSYVICIDKERISDCESVFLYPYLKKGKEMIQFPCAVIHGKARSRSYKRWVTMTGQQDMDDAEEFTSLVVTKSGKEYLPFETSFPYEEWMNGATLYVKQMEWSCGENVTESVIELAKLTVPEPKPVVVVDPKPEPPNQILFEEGTAFIVYSVGKSLIEHQLADNRRELSKISELINTISKTEGAKITGLEIIGYASPDGSYAVNDRLSFERARELCDHINTYHQLGLFPSQIKVSNVAEDWDGLKKMMEERNFPHREKVLKIISGTLSFDECELRLKQLEGGHVYKTMKESFFPKLRRAEYKIMYQINK